MHISISFFRKTVSAILMGLIAVFIMTMRVCWAAEPAGQGPVGWELLIIIYFGIVVLGVILGLGGRMVVFRNYDDLALVFGCGACLLAAIPFSEARLVQTALLLVSLGLGAVIVLRTWRDNGLLLLPIVLVTKLTLSVLWIHHLIQAVSPSGTNYLDRARSRGIALLVLGLLTPLVFRLVRDHEGFLTRRDRYEDERIQSG